MDESVQRETLASIREEFAATDPATLARLAPALSGIEMILHGQRFDAHGRGTAGERRLLGWACGDHWLLTQSN